MDVRRPLFWIAVGGTAILANAVLQIAADRIPSAGLKRLAQYTAGGTA